MSWNLPDLPTAGVTIATVANWATKVIDCFNYLKGNAGTVTLSDGLNLGTNELTVNSIEIVGVDGEVNKSAVEDHTHANVANCGQLDYGTCLVGAGDAEGDILYRNATVWTRLAKGTAGQYLTMNSGVTAPQWSTATPVPSGGIIMWAGTIANIPGAYIICDGNNSTPNLLARFVQGVATAATNPGATGGATSKTSGAPSAAAYEAYTAGTVMPSSTHTHTISDIRPLYYDLAFLLKT